MAKNVVIGLVQMSMSTDKSKNLEKALSLIEKAAKKGAKIVCLPEIFTTPYFPTKQDSKFFDLAEPIPGKTTDALSQAAKKHNIVLIGGSLFEKDGKKCYNTSVVFDEKGKILGKYRKVHIPHDPAFYEQDYFTPGDLGYKVFETTYGKIGIMICYDQWFPEAARVNALMGADMIFYPTAIGTVMGIEQTEGSWQEGWERVQRGHATANHVIVAAANRVGAEGDSRFWGGSFIADQFGNLLARGDDKEGIVLATCDLSLGKTVRDGWRFFYNRRPETYGKIVERKGDVHE